MTTNPVFDMVRAVKARQVADAEAKRAAQEVRHQEQLLLFQPVRDFYEAIAELPVREVRWHHHDWTTLRQCQPSVGISPFVIEFWGDDGNAGFALGVTTDSITGRTHIYHRNAWNRGGCRDVTVSEAVSLLAEYVVSREIQLPDTKDTA